MVLVRAWMLRTLMSVVVTARAQATWTGPGPLRVPHYGSCLVSVAAFL